MNKAVCKIPFDDKYGHVYSKAEQRRIITLRAGQLKRLSPVVNCRDLVN